jgi:endoglucanase
MTPDQARAEDGASTPLTAAPTPVELTVANSAFKDAPVPAKASGNPFARAKLWVNPQSQAAAQAASLKQSSPDRAAMLERIARQPTAAWLGEWSGDVKRYVQGLVQSTAGAMPVFVVYNLPNRDCGNHSKGGLANADHYRRWIREVSDGIGDNKAAVIVEPDALGLLDKCLSPQQQTERLALIQDAVRVLRQSPKVSVYIDAGHPHWIAANIMADRLKQSGIANANGFALNTSNYVATTENNAYGDQLSALLDGAHYVIDTSRNGNGSAPKDEWCNPSGRKLGAPPTTETGNPLVDAWFWTKPPGESDGECNGGPRAGTFWVAQAMELAAQ